MVRSSMLEQVKLSSDHYLLYINHSSVHRLDVAAKYLLWTAESHLNC